MAYNPNLPAGRASAENSAPVTVASDSLVSTDLANETRLDDIRQALMTIASTKGLAADLRVTVLSGVLNSLTTVTTLSQMAGLALNNAVPNWTNQTAGQSFTNNIVRS